MDVHPSLESVTETQSLLYLMRQIIVPHRSSLMAITEAAQKPGLFRDIL